MIILRLEGGLGNIMFQYALGRHLSYISNAPLKFDVSSYKTNPIADCSLWLEGFHIDISNNLATKNEIEYFKHFEYRPGKPKFLSNLFSDETKYVKEKQFSFNPNIFKLKNNLYLSGWWQSEKYFSSIRDLLLKDFT